MSVITRTWFSLIVLACMLPMAVLAQQRVLIRSASQLADDQTVRSVADSYRMVSSAQAIYIQCAVDLTITDEQKHYLDTMLQKTSKEYFAAYEAAFKARVGAPSSQALVDDYAKTIADQQQAATHNMALVIKQRGCKNSQIVAIADYIEKLRQVDLAAHPANVPTPAISTPADPAVAPVIAAPAGMAPSTSAAPVATVPLTPPPITAAPAISPVPSPAAPVSPTAQ